MSIKKWKAFLRKEVVLPLKAKGKQKIFCIGFNKTGTTSLKKAMLDLGYQVGNQRDAELLLPNYLAQEYQGIIKYCKSAQFFQDIPFSLPETYKILEDNFPNSKYILTLRDSPEQWYHSLCNFHSNSFSEGKLPNTYQLKNIDYVYKGFLWDSMNAITPLDENDPYKKEPLIRAYNDHIENVQTFFKSKEKSLLSINLAEKDSYKRLITFLEVDSDESDFPWENKTKKKVD